VDTRLPGLRRDALLAIVLALVLGAVWTWRGWSDLAALRLPDTDDVMRLQQVRDWLGGQAWRDLAQHRLGTGVAMHWTRLADLGPAALIALLSPATGRHPAEVAAVVGWPVVLFAVAIFLCARIARAVDGGGAERAATAAVVAAIAYPATTIFAPGRIDHHGLQAVLMLGAVLALVARPSRGEGIAIGLLAAASLVVGLETMPFIAVIGAAAVVEWGATGQRDRLLGVGVGAAAGLAIGCGMFAPAAWAYPACDGFTQSAWTAALPPVAASLALAALSPLLHGCRSRAVAAATAGALAAGVSLRLSPACLHPYGAVDPLLVRLWLSHVEEARPLGAVPLATAVGYAGVLVAGLVATAWRVRRAPGRGWATLLALLVAGLLLTAVQVRGAYVGALLAAPGLAAAIVAARAKGALPLAGAWAASAGMLYPIAADALTPPTGASVAGGDCSSPALLHRLAALPAGVVMSPIDAGAAIVAATSQRAVAGPYHRNTAGNLAAYQFYLGSPATATRIATRWRLGYIVVCAAMPGRTAPGTTAAALARASLPGWRPIAAFADGARLDSPR
jgi:hypothetical protein